MEKKAKFQGGRQIHNRKKKVSKEEVEKTNLFPHFLI